MESQDGDVQVVDLPSEGEAVSEGKRQLGGKGKVAENGTDKAGEDTSVSTDSQSNPPKVV